MSHRLLPVLILSFFVFCGSSTVFAEPTETAKRLAQAEADLKKARESLHVAHQELGEKTEMINRLERLLGKSPGERKEKEAPEDEMRRLTLELQAANSKIRELERKSELEVVAASAAKEKVLAAKAEARKAELKKVEAQMAEAKKIGASRAAAAPEIYRVSYELNSAASLEGRELALKWIQGKMRENSGAKFEIRGRANDTEFKEANRAIAGNRANFLASFLRVGGVPRDSLVTVSGDESAESGAAGRIVEVMMVP